MVSSVVLLGLLAAVPSSALGVSVSHRHNDDKKFDYDDLTLREVGARNTLVGGD